MDEELTAEERAANVLRVEYGTDNMTDWHLPINLHDLIAAEINAAVEAEREACAALFEGSALFSGIPRVIRARGEKA